MQKTSILVMDTSSVLQAIFKEQYADIVKKIIFLKDTYKLSLFMPTIFQYEFLNTVTRKKGYKMATEAYRFFTEKQVSLVPFEEDLMKNTTQLMEKYPGTTFYDASFHALAKAYDTDFITADKKYYELTKEEGHVKLLEDCKF